MRTISHRELRSSAPVSNRERRIRAGDLRLAASRPDFGSISRVVLPAGTPSTQEVLDDLRGDR